VRVAGDDDANAADVEEGDRAARAARQEAELDRLATRAVAGDRGSLDQLIGHIRPAVVRYCRARLGSRPAGLQAPEDVAQEVLIAVCGALPRYRPGATPVMAFVYAIASNKVVDAFRAAGRDRSRPTEAVPDTIDDGPGPDDVAVLGSEVDALRLLLEQIPEQYREVLVLRVALGFSAEETARTIGSTPGAVRVTQHRALTRLRRLISERTTTD
jgi:RNA polymerase sigma-70 factor (ECF subfamily)